MEKYHKYTESDHHNLCSIPFCFVAVSAMFSFSTRLHEDTTTSDSPVIFGTVDLNVGDGYDEFTGNVNA